MKSNVKEGRVLDDGDENKTNRSVIISHVMTFENETISTPTVETKRSNRFGRSSTSTLFKYDTYAGRCVNERCASEWRLTIIRRQSLA